MASIAKLLGVSRSTLYKALPELVSPQMSDRRLPVEIVGLTRPGRPAAR